MPLRRIRADQLLQQVVVRIQLRMSLAARKVDGKAPAVHMFDRVPAAADVDVAAAPFMHHLEAGKN
ncbi:MAG: hypothetical protein EOO28_26130 [Comamonadaceae bacterium]|nr:MAG: hypothetical protein EOO28_26130 [Comamonadaceae bacterium]